MPKPIPIDKRKWGYIPDVPASEDKVYSSVMAAGERPEVIDLSPRFRNAVEDQKRTASCSANACVSALEYLIALEHQDDPNYNYPELSRMFAYYNARKIRGLHTVDAGSVIRDCVDQLRAVGVCEEALWPFITTKVNNQPFKIAYSEAVKSKVGYAARLSSLDAMLDCLSQGYPFVFGFQVYSGSMTQAARTGVMPMPTGSRQGGHAVLAVGYDMRTRRFKIRNSWSRRWGNDGYYLMDFEYVAGDLSTDHWTLRAFS